jgi:carbohydrate-binding DOMON domain-containing protein
VFDIATFSAGVDGADFVFRFDLNGPINNHWGSGINLSIQTFDIYIDVDPGASTGTRLLLDGRNAALTSGSGWDMAVWVEGWNQKVFVPDDEGNPQEVSGSNVKVVVNPSGSISIRVSGAVLPQLGANDSGEWTLDPTTFGYAAMVLSQDGFPSVGVLRVRDVEGEASQWRLGGGPDDTNHTRIIDLVLDGDQTEGLGAYPSSQESIGELGSDDFAQLPLLLVD